MSWLLAWAVYFAVILPVTLAAVYGVAVARWSVALVRWWRDQRRITTR